MRRLITRAVSMSSSVKIRSPRPGLGRPTACMSSRRNPGCKPDCARDVAERVAPGAAERELDGQRRQALLGVGSLDLLAVGARAA